MNEDNLLVESVEIDTLVNMVKMAYAFENWDKVLTLADQLLVKAKDCQCRQFPKTRAHRHFAYYYGYSHMMKGLAYQKLKEYSLSAQCVTAYSDLNWLNDSSEECMKVIEDFKLFAKGNALTLEVLTGNRAKYDEYVHFINDHPEEALSGMITILESAVFYSYNVDDNISKLLRLLPNPTYGEDRVTEAKYLSVYYMLALYNYKNKNFSQALDNTIHTLVESDKMCNDKYFKKAVALFEVLKTRATVSQLNEYSNILNKIVKGEMEVEKNTAYNNGLARNF